MKIHFTFSLRELSKSVRKSFVKKEKVIKSKKAYNRKNKNWKNNYD